MDLTSPAAGPNSSLSLLSKKTPRWAGTTARAWGGSGSARGVLRCAPVGDPAAAAALVAAIDRRRGEGR